VFKKKTKICNFEEFKSEIFECIGVNNCVFGTIINLLITERSKNATKKPLISEKSKKVTKMNTVIEILFIKTSFQTNNIM
jgi:hypothetical protein